MKHDNDNSPKRASDFPDTDEGRASRRAWLETAPATHADYHVQSPCVTWAKREKDETTFMGLKLWRAMNEPPRMAATDNGAQDEEEAEVDRHPVLANMDREMVDVSAKQLVYAAERGMVRWQGTRLVKSGTAING